MTPRYRSAVDIVEGYELSPDTGLLSVVLPIQRTNLVTNPSFETNATGYTAVSGATLTRTTEDQRRGAYSLSVKPGVAQESGVYYTTSALSAGAVYAFSLDVKIPGGRKWVISIYDGIRTIVQKKVIGKGYWERVNVVGQVQTSGAHRLYLQKDNNTNVDSIFTDGWQLELCDTVTATSVYNLTDPSLVAYWKLEETLAASRLDSVGANHLTPNNNPVATLGKINFSNQFVAGSTQYLTINDNAALSMSDIDMTIIGWFNLSDKANAYALFAKGSGGVANTEYLLLYNNGTDRFQFSVSSGVTQNSVSASSLGSPTAGAWYFIVCKHDSVNNIISIQINGGTIDTTAHAAGIQDSNNTFRIGAYSSAALLYSGLADEMGIWKRNLTADELSFLYNSGNGMTYPFTVDSVLNNGNGFPTTYIDGEQLGVIPNQVAYYWNGTPHASTSTRIANTRAGGKIVNLQQLGFRVLSIVGLGFAPVTNIATQYGLIDGSLYQRSVIRSRNFTVVGHIDAETHQDLLRQRQELSDALNLDSAGIRQPLTLIYQQVDERGKLNGEELEIVCSYASGLEGNFNNRNAERLALQFTAYDPFIISAGEHGKPLTFASDVTNANKIVKLSKQNGWSAVADGFSGLGNVDTLLYVNGVLYAASTSSAGNFTIFSGSTRTTISTFNGAIHALAASPDGSIIYIGGNFTTVGAVSSPGIVAYNVATATFSQINTAIAGVGDVSAIAINSDGTIYVGGQFTAIGGVTVANLARRSAGGVWSKLTSGAGVGGGAIVRALKVGLDGYLYIGGAFTAIDGSTYNYIARYNLSTEVISAMSSGMNLDVYSIAIGRDGLIYIGGDFTTSGGITTNGLTSWNGVSYSPLGSGVSHPSNAVVRAIDFTPQGELYIVGTFSAANGISVPSGMAVWNGSTLRPIAIDLPGSDNLYAIEVDDLTGDVYFGYDTSGTASAAGTTVVTYRGTGPGYPSFQVTGPGVLYQIANLTNDKYLHFNALTLLSGEVMTIITQPGKITVKSNFRPSLLSYLSSASDISSFKLIPGNNTMSAFMDDASGSAGILMKWRELHHGIGGGVRR